jgi:hypothetical protein
MLRPDPEKVVVSPGEENVKEEIMRNEVTSAP